MSRKNIAHIRGPHPDRTLSFRSSEQLFVCNGGQQKGKAVSKQRLAHWIVDAIALAHQSQGEPCPLGVCAHSIWSVASSYALVHGASYTSAELRAGQHRATSQDSTVFALSQFLPVCWVTGNEREELAGVTLRAFLSLLQTKKWMTYYTYYPSAIPPHSPCQNREP